jgi:hypothetical protein
VHRKYIPIYIQQDVTLHTLFVSGKCSICFGWYFHPSSGAHTTVSTASGICHTVTAICRYQLEPVWVCCGWRTLLGAHSILHISRIRVNATCSAGGQGQAPAALPPKKRPGTHCRVGWVHRKYFLGVATHNLKSVSSIHNSYHFLALCINTCIAYLTAFRHDRTAIGLKNIFTASCTVALGFVHIEIGLTLLDKCN